ncbi:MAG: CoxG family protein [Beutenbergiaceae bacterium]
MGSSASFLGIAIARTAARPLLWLLVLLACVICWMGATDNGTAAGAVVATVVAVATLGLDCFVLGRAPIRSPRARVGSWLLVGSVVVSSYITGLWWFVAVAAVLALLPTLMHSRTSTGMGPDATNMRAPTEVTASLVPTEVENPDPPPESTWSRLRTQWSVNDGGSSFEQRASLVVNEGRESLFPALLDVNFVVGCIPGCESAEEIAPLSRYSGSIRKRLGPFLVRMRLDVEVLEVQRPSALMIRAEGADTKLRSDVAMLIGIFLEPASDSSTRLQIEVLARVNGVLSSIDPYLVSGQFEATIAEFVAELNANLVRRDRSNS